MTRSKRNRVGYLAVVLPLAGIVACGLLAACGSSSPSKAASTQTTVATGSGTKTVQLVDNPKMGKILADSRGMTLYFFENDKGTTSACITAPCLPTWPGYASAAAPSAGPGIDAAKLGTAHGQVANQVTYGGHLLYNFAGDSKPGDVNGTTIPHWYTIGANGMEVEAPAPASSTTTHSSSGY